MKVSYKKLWVLCAEKEMSKNELRKMAGISPATFTKMRKNKEVSLAVLMKIAEIIRCNVGDMMDFVPGDPTDVDAEKGQKTNPPNQAKAKKSKASESPEYQECAEIAREKGIPILSNGRIKR